jgi:Ribbon-helix-helix protein, copG family.
MSECIGNLSIGSRVDKQMLEFLDAEAERLGVNRAELVRRLFDAYRESHREQMDCPHCGDTITLSLKS